MDINDFTIFCGPKRNNNELRFSPIYKQDTGTIVCKINTSANKFESIKLFLDSESDLINFKNSVVNAVNNWKENR